MTPLHILIAGCVWFAVVIAILAFFHACKLSRERQRDAAPDMRADKAGIGANNLIHGASD